MSLGMALRPKEITAPELLKKLNSRSSRTPILLVWGKQDQFIPIKIGFQIHRMYPWIKLRMIDQCGHCPHDELPDSFVNEFLRWLESDLYMSTS